MFGDWKYEAIAVQSPVGRMLIKGGQGSERKWRAWVKTVDRLLMPFYLKQGWDRSVEDLALAVYTEGIWLAGVERKAKGVGSDNFSRRIFSRAVGSPMRSVMYQAVSMECELLDAWLESVLYEITNCDTCS